MSQGYTAGLFSMFIACTLGSTSAYSQSQWEAVLPQVKQECAQEWPNDYDMQAYCIRKQKKGFDEINGSAASGVESGPARGRPAPGTMPSDASSLQSEADLLNVVAKYRDLYETASNDLIKGSLRPERGQAICRAVASPAVHNWSGTVEALSSNADGDGVITISLGGGVSVKTMNNSFSDSGVGTMIRHRTPLYADVVGLGVGQTIEFSGVLFRDPVDCYRELSLTVTGAMREPEFLVRVTSVRHEPDAHVPAEIQRQASSTPVAPVSAPPARNTAMTPDTVAESDAFAAGRTARLEYEEWFAHITSEDYRNGVIFWASRRSQVPPPASCHFTSADFEAGCLEAKRRLTPADARRKAEPNFKQGWNSQ